MDMFTLSSPQPMRHLELGEVLCKWDVTNLTFLCMGIFVGISRTDGVCLGKKHLALCALSIH